MLNTLRENLKQKSWPKWILLLVAASMTLYLAAGVRGCDDENAPDARNWAAKLDGEPIPTQDFIKLARRMDQTYRQLFGQNYNDMRSQVRVGSQAMQLLLEQNIILRDARGMGLDVSDSELIDRITSRPDLADASGVFIGKTEYENRMNRFFSGGVAAFEAEVAEEILIEKWLNVISQSIAVDDADVEGTFRQRNEKTSIEYIIVNSADQDIETSINDEQAAEWYNANSELYRRDEGRRIRYAIVKRTDDPSTIEISDDEINAAYETNQAQYSHPEQRRVSHILLRVEPEATDEDRERVRAEAEEILGRVRAGEDFAALARTTSQDTFSGQRGGDLDWFGRGQMVPEFEESAFLTPSGQLAPLTETQFGYHVILVTDTREAGTTPLDDVREAIVNELRVARAEEHMVTEAGRIRDRIDSPESFDAIAVEEGLEVLSSFVNETEGMRELGASADFRSAVLEMEAGTVSAPLRVSRGMAVVVVDEILPESIAPLEDVDERVRTDLLNDRAVRLSRTVAEQALDQREDFADVAAALDAEAEDSGELAPGQSLPGSGGSSIEMQEALFGDAVTIGDRGVVGIPSGTVVYEVTNRQPFDAIAFEEQKETLRAELLQQRRLAMRRSMVDELSRQLEIVINEPLVERLDGGA